MMANLFCKELESVVSRQPTAIAIECDGNRWTYAELWQRTNDVAGLIRECVSPKQVVGINLDKSSQYVACLIGIWRANCVALPLSPRHPTSRSTDFLARAQAAAVISDVELDCGLPHLVSCPIAHHSQIAEEPAPNDLAYVLFTSGSTGRAKAVAVEHAGIVPMLKSQITAFEMNTSSRSLFYLSTMFDASISDIGTALLCGGTLVLDSSINDLSVVDLFTRIDDLDITYADLPPAVMTRAAKLGLQSPSCLKTVVVGGEVCSAQTIRWWSLQLRLVNVYGPTEATICTSLNVLHECNSEVPTIGTPIASMQYRIDPDSSNPAIGELWISGPGLARGYMDDPALSNQRFVWRDGQRWYRTGDLVEFNAAGAYVFHGRIDRQFKLLGKLVEPAEIENAILRIPGVAASAVVPINNESGRPHAIGALIQCLSPEATDEHHIRQRLGRSLPVWMVPQVIRISDSIPLTDSGKPDFARVAVQLQQRAHTACSTIPSDEHAETLRRIWSNVLQLEPETIEWDDDFFLLGGDSLSAMQILAQSRSDGIDVSIDSLYQGRTLRNCLRGTRIGRDSQSLESAADDLVRHHCHSSTVDDSKPRRYLVTGANGLLGTWIVEELLTHQTGEIECLVRARDPQHGLARINSARTSLLGDECRQLTSSDVVVSCGDVGQPLWGSNEWERLTNDITDIVHLAADVHLLNDFESLRPSNLNGTATAISLQQSGPPKFLHYASTLSVFVGSDSPQGIFFERDRLDSEVKLFGGYAQTKWAAEKLLWKRKINGLGVYRLGLLAGDSVNGVGASADQLSLFTRGIAELGVLPLGFDSLCFDLTPIDHAAKTMAALIENQSDGSFHVCGRSKVTLGHWAEAMRSIGLEVQEVDLQTFHDAIHSQLIDGAEHAAVACLSLYYRLAGQRDWDRTADLFLATGVQFDTCETDRQLANLDITIPNLDQSYLTKLVHQMMSAGSFAR